jgi:predicted RNase H-like nuclease (RuvC/YqgF family)
LQEEENEDVAPTDKRSSMWKRLVSKVLTSENNKDENGDIQELAISKEEMYNAVLAELEMKEEELVAMEEAHKAETFHLQKDLDDATKSMAQSVTLAFHHDKIDKWEKKVDHLKGKLARSQQREDELTQELEFDRKIIQTLQQELEAAGGNKTSNVVEGLPPSTSDVASPPPTRARKSFFF